MRRHCLYLALAGTLALAALTQSAPAAGRSVAAHKPTPPPAPIAKVSELFELIERSEEPGAAQRLEAVLKGHPNLERQDPFGKTPLMAAIARGGQHEAATEIRPYRYDAVLLLLKYGAKVDGKGRQDLTPLHVAAEHNDVNVTYLLMKNGARPDESVLQKCVPFGPDVFNILLHKGVAFDIPRMLDKLIWFGRSGAEFLEHILARPIEIPPSYEKSLAQARRQSLRDRAPMVAAIAEHMRLMAAAKGAKHPPKLPYPLAPAFPEQAVPPLADPALIVAVRQGDLAKVAQLVATGANVNAICAAQKNVLPASALHLALAANYEELAAFLIEHGAQLNWRAADGDTPLIIAARSGRLPMVQTLLRKGADPNRPNSRSLDRALDAAASVDVMAALVAKSAAVNYRTRYGSSMQTWVASQKKDRIAFLLKKGADLNIKNFDERTPLSNLLYWQSMSHRPEEEVPLSFIKFLVEHGADLKAKDQEDFSAYDWAVKDKRQDIADYLQKRGGGTGNDKVAFHDAIRRGDVATLTRMLDAGFDPNAETYVFAVLSENPDYTVTQGRAPDGIPHAAEIVRLLVAHGANATASGADGRSALHVATDPDLVDFLVKKGVDVDAVDARRRTPLHVMAAAARVDAVRALLKNGAFPNARAEGYGGEPGPSPLDIALSGPQDQRPADGPPPDFEREGPKYLEVIRLLIEAGADGGDYLSGKKTIDRPRGDTAKGYETFDEQARAILRSTHATVATKAATTPARLAYEVPYLERSLLFLLIGDKFLDAKYRASRPPRGRQAAAACPIDVLAAAHQLYAAEPDAAKDFQEFLSTLRWSGGTDGSLTVMAVSPEPEHGVMADYTLLHMAAYYNDAPLVRTLLAAGADPQARDVVGDTPLHASVRGPALSDQARWRTMELLLGAKIDVNAKSLRGGTPALLNQKPIDEPGGVIPNSVDTRTGKPAVRPSKAPDVAPIAYLIDHGADVKATDDEGKTVLDALNIGTRALADLPEGERRAYLAVIDAVKAKGGKTHLTKVDPRTREVTITTFNGREAVDPPLIEAVRVGDTAKVKALLTEGASVTQRGYIGETALSVAVASGNLTVLKLLLAHGGDLQNIGGHSPDGWDFTHASQSALTVAVTAKKYQLVKPLIALGTRASAVDEFNMLQQAGASLSQSGKEALQSLINHGAPANVCNIQGQSLLASARAKGNEEFADLLVRNGATEGHCPKDREIRKNHAGRALLAKVVDALAPASAGEKALLAVWQAAAPGCYDAEAVIPSAYRKALRNYR